MFTKGDKYGNNMGTIMYMIISALQ